MFQKIKYGVLGVFVIFFLIIGIGQNEIFLGLVWGLVTGFIGVLIVKIVEYFVKRKKQAA